MVGGYDKNKRTTWNGWVYTRRAMGHGVIRGNDSWKVSGSFLKTSSVSNERVDRGISRESNDFVSGQISFLSVSSRWRRSLLKFRWRSPWKRGFSAALQLFHGKLRSSLDGISRDSSGILRFQAGRIYFNPFAFLFYPQSMEIIVARISLDFLAILE